MILLMARRCPWCKEPFARRQRKAERCPHCGRQLAEADGAEVRAIDLRYSEVVEAQRARLGPLLLWGGVATGTVALVLPTLTVGAAVVVPILVLTHGLVVRLFLIRDARRLLGPTRRMFTRWIGRFSFLWIGLPGYSLMVTPLAGVVVGVATFVGLTALVHHYTEWSLTRELGRQGLMRWEKLLLVSLALLSLLAFAVLAVLGLLLGWSVSKLIEMFQNGS